MFNFKDYVETDIEEKKEIIKVLPVNTVARKRKYVDTLLQIKEEYENHMHSIKEFINYNYDKLLPKKEEIDFSKYLQKRDKLWQLFMLDSSLTDYYEKLNLNYYIYILMHYYDYSISELNSTISKIVETFQTVGISLSKDDFRLNTYSYIYMKYFFDGYFVIDGDYSLTPFQNIYWKCPNVFLYIVDNFRYIFKKHSRTLNKYISRYLADNFADYQIDTPKQLYDDLVSVNSKIISLKEENEYDIVHLCLEKEIDINYYREDSKNILSDYDFFSIKPVNVNDDSERETFVESLKKLVQNLDEYQKYLKYQPIIDYCRKNFVPKPQNKEKLFEIKKIRKEISKLESRYLWKEMLYFPNSKFWSDDILSKDLTEEQQLKLADSDKLLQQIYKLYEKYDELYYDYKIRSMIKDTSKVNDIFYLLISYPIFARKIIKESLELSEKSEVTKVLDELKELFLNPEKKVITMIPVFEDSNIPQILMNGYRFENLDVTEDTFEDTNIRIVFERANKIFRELKIKKFNLSIDQIEFLVNVYGMKKNKLI